MFGGGGPVVVGRHDRPGRFEDGTSPILKGHSGAVLDMEWSPFDDTMLATASDDATIKIWSIPDDWEPTGENGVGKAGKDISESMLTLDGHAKKVTLLRYHPTASNTLMSTSADHTIKIWDVESGQAVVNNSDLSDLVQDIIWDVNGDSFACTNKDKNIRLFDARTGGVTSMIEKAHDGVKSTKLSFMGDRGLLLSTGASRQSGREMKVWDIKNMSKPLKTEAVDTASGALIPLYDLDTDVLFLCGKGDGIVRIYEYDDKEKIVKLNDGFRSTSPGKGYCVVPKRGLDVMSCELMRIMKVTNSDGVHPLSFIVPRKSDAFQDDIFPDAPCTTPAHSCAEWLGGSSKPPVTAPLNPKSAGNASSAAANAPKKVFKTVPMLEKEVTKLEDRVSYLEKKLQEAGIEF